VWQLRFGGAGEDTLSAVTRATDGKFALAGSIFSAQSASKDVLLMKFGSNGYRRRSCPYRLGKRTHARPIPAEEVEKSYPRTFKQGRYEFPPAPYQPKVTPTSAERLAAPLTATSLCR
jgi:hypothetical protein